MMCVVRPVHDLRWHGLPQDGRVLNIGHEQSCQRACHGSLASATLASAPADAAHTIPGPVAKSFSMGSYKGHAGTIVNRRHACYYQHMRLHSVSTLETHRFTRTAEAATSSRNPKTLPRTEPKTAPFSVTVETMMMAVGGVGAAGVRGISGGVGGGGVGGGGT